MTVADPRLPAGYEGMKRREKTIPPQGQVRIPEAIERLVRNSAKRRTSRTTQPSGNRNLTRSRPPRRTWRSSRN